MLYTHYTEELLGLQDVIIEKIEEAAKKVIISIQKKRQAHICPVCGRKTDVVHDYRLQIVADLPLFGKTAELHYRKRRYRCECGKRFFERSEFLQRYQRRTNRMNIAVLEKLGSVQSYDAVGKEFNISGKIVMRLFDNIRFPKPSKLPTAIGIDEFKGNSGKEKYHCILTDLENGRVIDILRTRKQHNLCDYFKQYSREERSRVKYFVSDMYKTFAEMAKTYFPNAIYVTDKYHWIRQAIWAVEAVRKEEQKKFCKEYRSYFKHSKNLLLKRQTKLEPEQWQRVSNMLYIAPKLSCAYFLKEHLYSVLDCEDSAKQASMLRDWISEALESELAPFIKCAKTYSNWYKSISNSFKCKYTNGFTEGCNNKIKVLKRNAFGVRNFSRFRNRILFLFDSPVS